MNPANMIILPPILPGRSLHLHEKTLMRRSLSPFKLGPIEGLKVKPSIYGVTYAAFIDILLASLRYQVSRRSVVDHRNMIEYCPMIMMMIIFHFLTGRGPKV